MLLMKSLFTAFCGFAAIGLAFAKDPPTNTADTAKRLSEIVLEADSVTIVFQPPPRKEEVTFSDAAWLLRLSKILAGAGFAPEERCWCSAHPEIKLFRESTGIGTLSMPHGKKSRVHGMGGVSGDFATDEKTVRALLDLVNEKKKMNGDSGRPAESARVSVNPEAPPSPATCSIAGARAELEMMLKTDQAHRRELIELEKKHGADSAEMRETWAKQNTIDAQNIRRLEEIIAAHGWPGLTQFGGKAASAAFLILQHADIGFQKKYLPLAREAAAKGEMRASSLALLEDRVRLRECRKQIYGSQVTRNSAGEWEPRPLEDEENVDARRASVGLRPISEYLQLFSDNSGGRVSPKWAMKEPAKAPEPAPATVTSPAAQEPRGP